jgi:hypothetical protein
MTDPYPELAPFAVDTWPTCEPWERAGVETAGDRRAIGLWARTAQRRLRLDIDARFDRILGRMYATAWPGVVWDDLTTQEDPTMSEQETDTQRLERETREREQRELDEQREREAAAAQEGEDDGDDDDDDDGEGDALASGA